MSAPRWIEVDDDEAARYPHDVSEAAQTVLADALRLSVDDRADVAAKLLRSLDVASPVLSADDVERSWAAEITRRAERAIRGESVGRDSDDVLATIDLRRRER